MWAIAQLAVDADTCTGCGQPLSESTHPDNEGAYDADLPTRCHACDTLLAAQEGAYSKGGYQRPEALRWAVIKREGARNG